MFEVQEQAKIKKCSVLGNASIFHFCRDAEIGQKAVSEMGYLISCSYHDMVSDPTADCHAGSGFFRSRSVLSKNNLPGRASTAEVAGKEKSVASGKLDYGCLHPRY